MLTQADVARKAKVALILRARPARFDPDARDGDNDGMVQDGTPFRRPARPRKAAAPAKAAKKAAPAKKALTPAQATALRAAADGKLKWRRKSGAAASYFIEGAGRGAGGWEADKYLPLSVTSALARLGFVKVDNDGSDRGTLSVTEAGREHLSMLSASPAKKAAPAKNAAPTIKVEGVPIAEFTADEVAGFARNGLLSRAVAAKELRRRADLAEAEVGPSTAARLRSLADELEVKPAKKAAPAKASPAKAAAKKAAAKATAPRVDPFEGNPFEAVETAEGWKVVEKVADGPDRTYRDNQTRTGFVSREAAEAHIDRIVQAREQLKATLGFDGLLGDGPATIKHKPTRQVLEQMEAHGWRLVSPTLSGSAIEGARFEAPDGRSITLHLRNRNGQPDFSTGEGQGWRQLTYKAALAHVVTPTPPERPDNPGVYVALDRLGLLSAEDRRDIGLRSFDPTLRQTLLDAQRTIQSAQFETVAVAAATKGLRERAAQIEGLGTPDVGRRAATLRRVADELDRLAAGRDEYERDARRRAAAPLDIRPARVRQVPAPAKAAKTARAGIASQRALAANLSPEEVDLYVQAVARNPGLTVSEWRIWREHEAEVAAFEERRVSGRLNPRMPRGGVGDADAAEAGRQVMAGSPDENELVRRLGQYRVLQLRAIARALDITVPPKNDGAAWQPEALRRYLARAIVRDRGRFTWR